MKTGALLFLAGLWIVFQAGKGDAINRLGLGSDTTTVNTTVITSTIN
jgi:hypothetical protein